MAAVIEEARARTRDLFGLPDGESIEVEFVRDTPWLGYHEYLGDLRGHISINVDRPRSAISLVHLALHEAYAGHQAERCNKEVTLVRGRGLIEETVALVAAPQSVVSEGLAELAVELLLDGSTGSAFEAVVHDHGVELDLAHARAVARATEPLSWPGVDARADAARGGAALGRGERLPRRSSHDHPRLGRPLGALPQRPRVAQLRDLLPAPGWSCVGPSWPASRPGSGPCSPSRYASVT